MDLTDEEIYKLWIQNEIFKKQNDINKDKELYAFYDGPPFMTGPPHYGHCIAGFIKDTVTRHKISNNYYVPRISGADTHGLPIEYEIEKKIGLKTTKDVLNFGISNYNNECKQIVFSCKNIWKDTMNKLGRWIDFDNGYTTMSKEFMNSVWWVFSELYKKDRIYEGVKVMPYSTSCGTPLSNFETQQNYKEIDDDSLFFKIKINHTILNDIYMIVWTTTPWTLVSNYLLAINKNFNYCIIVLDDIENELLIIEENLINNVFNKKKFTIKQTIKGEELLNIQYKPLFTFNKLHNNYIIVHGDFVLNTTGTGIVHISPSFGMDDYNLCLTLGIIQKNSKLFIPLNQNGFVNHEIPIIEGLFYKNYNNNNNNNNNNNMDLNKWTIQQLKLNNLYVDKKTIKHNYPFCWRSDTPLIYMAVSSHFVKVEDMSDSLLKLNSQINWYPKNIGDKRFSSWIANTRDWGISRNRFWGTPIPIWKSNDGEEICITSSYELEILLNMPVNSINDLHRDFIDNLIITKNGKTFKRIDTIFDCWFESGSMPLGFLGKCEGIVNVLRNSITGIEYDENNYPFIKTKDNLIHKILPADFIAEGLDQTRGWFYTLLVISTSLFNTIPFKNVIVNGIILADNGEKMSKRLKNYPEIDTIIEKYSSDCLRLYLLNSPACNAEPLKFNQDGVFQAMKLIVLKIKKGTIPFFKEYIKLYYDTAHISPLHYKLSDLTLSNSINIWILQKYLKYRNEYFNYMDNYNLRQASEILYNVIEDLNNGYIKIAKYLFKCNDLNECKESLNTLYFLLKYISNDFKAIIPFLSESIHIELTHIFLKFNNVEILNNDNNNMDSIHLKNYELFITFTEEQNELSNNFNIVYEIIKGIYKIRSKHNKNAKIPLKNIYLFSTDTIINELYYDYIIEECNILNICNMKESEITINTQIIPNKTLLFKKYGKDFKDVFKELINFDEIKLNDIIKNKYYKDFNLTQDDFNIKYDIKFIDNIDNSKILEMEEINFENHKIFIIADMTFDEEIEKLYYCRLFIKKIQLMRKKANLHTWDKINIYWKGQPKYTFDENMLNYIVKTIKMNIYEYDENIENIENIIIDDYCENTNLHIYVEKI